MVIGLFAALEVILVITVVVFNCNSVRCCVWSLTKTELTKDGLPTVDLADSKAPIKLTKALENWGFSYVTGHQVPNEIIEKANEESKLFFKLPSRVKRALKAEKSIGTKTTRGYTSLRSEQLNAKGKPDLKEVLDIGHVNKKTRNRRQVEHYLGQNKWTGTNEGLRRATETYSEYVSEIAENILHMTAIGLGCPGAFETAFGPDSLQVQRLTKYPSSHEIDAREPGEIGSGVHSDYGGITVLYAEGPGLFVLKPNRTSTKNSYLGTFSPELKVPHSEEWVQVDALKRSFIVMAGEALQILSNGQIYAAKHKVEYNGSLPRYSLAFFYDPNPEAILEPSKCFRKNGKSLYRAKVAGHKGVIRKLKAMKKSIKENLE